MKEIRKGFMERFSDFLLDKIVPPITKFSNLRPMQVIRNGIVGTMPAILVSSFFLVLYILSSPSVGTSGKPLVGYLAPYADKFAVVNGYGLGFLALYASITLGVEFAKIYKLDITSMTVLSLASFIALNIDGVVDGTISVANFGAQGLVGCFVSTFIAGYVLKFCAEKNLVIKMPDSVPSQIGNSFSAVIPFLISITIFWMIRTIMNIDLTLALIKLFEPLFKAADSVVGYTIYNFLKLSFWSVGIHGDNMLGGVVSPLQTMWIAENAEAMREGVALTALPHIWTEGLDRCLIWTSAVWGLMFWLFKSKVKSHRTLATAALVPGIFTIVEPIMFGLPIVLNPILMIPMIISGVLSSAAGYLIMSLGVINRFFIPLPWATPPPLLAILSTGGDWKALILVIVALIIGILVYWPFFKVLEKVELQKELAREDELGSEV